jgi:hypothetical protein
MTRLSWMAGATAAIAAGMLGLLALLQGGQTTVTAGHPHAAATPSSASPSPNPFPKPVHNLCDHPVGSVVIYFANKPVDTKESPWAVGPPIIKGRIHAKDVSKVITLSWPRLCDDPMLAASVAHQFDHTINPYVRPTNRQWQHLLHVIWDNGGWQSSRHPRLVFMNPNSKWSNPWTDYMKPGPAPKVAPQLGYLPYPDSGAWFLVIRNLRTSQDVYLRLGCGLQVTAPRSELPVATQRH